MAEPHAPEVLVESVLIASERISRRVSELGQAISRDYEGRDLRMITVLKGGLFFLADLCRAVDLPVRIDFMAVSSYIGGRPGAVRITKDLDDTIEGADVIVVEDVIDTGLTLNYVLSVLSARKPSSLHVCTFLDKDVRRIVDLPVTYRGFDVPDRFLVGYGLDIGGLYRNIPYIATVREDCVRR
ncbi:MAG: hypoxanthine phosphoribosyltransferase [Coriobacteriia bacterium]|nr:hypoxanthine phosphoribosyltransferase [Coriobacteriia bacterium]